MGYYTTFELDVVDGEFPADFDATFESVTGYSVEHLEDTIKWYNHESDMKKISSMYPGVLFRLRGEGEENGDIWQKFYKDGVQHQVWRLGDVVFPEYDYEKGNE